MKAFGNSLLCIVCLCAFTRANHQITIIYLWTHLNTPDNCSISSLALSLSLSLFLFLIVPSSYYGQPQATAPHLPPLHPSPFFLIHTTAFKFATDLNNPKLFYMAHSHHWAIQTTGTNLIRLQVSARFRKHSSHFESISFEPNSNVAWRPS